MDILEAIADPNLFAPWFKDPESWTAWRAFHAVLTGAQLTPDQAAIYAKHTGRQSLPTAPFTEAWLCCGRRAGKSFNLALLAVYLATFKNYQAYLSPGEKARVRVMSVDRDQARVIMDYIRALLSEVPMLTPLVERESAETIELRNRIVIEVGTSSYRTARGYSFVAVLCDEISFWRDGDSSANPAEEVLRAVRPGLGTIPGSMLICASSPYSRTGVMWSAFQKHHSRDDSPVLFWKSDTRSMNPSFSQTEVDAEYEKDPASAVAEYGGEFRTDVESFVSIEAIQACQDGVRERDVDHRSRYHAFCDPAGGNGTDSMSLAISHRSGNTTFLDCVREIRPPFSPAATIDEFAALLKKYRISTVVGDRFGGDWVREPFRMAGIHYELSEKTKSQIYQALLPLILSTAVVLLDNNRLVSQLISLERKTHRGGRDSIDHAPKSHDDLCNAAGGALVLASERPAGWRRRDRELTVAAPELTATRLVGPAAAGSGRGSTDWMYKR